MTPHERWKYVQEAIPKLTLVTCVVKRHEPYGFFTEIPGVPFEGLVQITDIADTANKLTLSDFPVLGAKINAVVLGFRDSNFQIWLGIKPSQLSQTKTQG